MILKRRLFFTIFAAIMIFAYQLPTLRAAQLVKGDGRESKETKHAEVLESWQVNNLLAQKINSICSLENKDVTAEMGDLEEFLEQHGDQVTVVSNAVYLEAMPNEIIKLLARYCTKLQKIELAYCKKVQAEAINNLLYNNKKNLSDLSLVHMKQITAEIMQFISIECTRLKFLCLSGCPTVTNDDLANIGRNLFSLKILYLYETQGWLPGAINFLYQQRPGIKIFTDNFFSSCLIL